MMYAPGNFRVLSSRLSGVVLSQRAAWPGATAQCTRGQDALNGAISGEISAFQAANAGCLTFCNPAAGTDCHADCSQGLDALQASCHSEAAHVYKLTATVSFNDGLGQEVVAYACLAAACGSSDALSYSAWREEQRCIPIANLTAVQSCTVGIVQDDVISDAEASAMVAGSVILALSVFAIVVVAALAWWCLWKRRLRESKFTASAALAETDSIPTGTSGSLQSCNGTAGGGLGPRGPGAEMTPILSGVCASGLLPAAHQAPTQPGTPVEFSSVGLASQAGHRESFATALASTLMTPQRKGTREDVFKSRYGAASTSMARTSSAASEQAALSDDMADSPPLSSNLSSTRAPLLPPTELPQLQHQMHPTSNARQAPARIVRAAAAEAGLEGVGSGRESLSASRESSASSSHAARPGSRRYAGRPTGKPP